MSILGIDAEFPKRPSQTLLRQSRIAITAQPYGGDVQNPPIADSQADLGSPQYKVYTIDHLVTAACRHHAVRLPHIIISTLHHHKVIPKAVSENTVIASKPVSLLKTGSEWKDRSHLDLLCQIRAMVNEDARSSRT